ncbi:ClC family H(+)/Cl(-) exchange transporter [Thermoanaerobacterium sp. RBIITD]|uniref:ClC family H(+)/Cl(-) exchange transporter n=1 Tax=Thermoanaerobacterium sp. RBIITD TaxID=1550240 RepID=UPI000BB8262A|nr:ClC family H(+)/Cl(-) exchange transporter [Thermoanaerobacterium sp. RBIITD]SNX53167.1 H+/Cl- antiporter ClcA [Thermoanaerobacterium sp. RBIITD]
MNGNSHIYEIFKNRENFKERLVVEGIVVGIFTGLIVSLFRFILEKAGTFILILYKFLDNRIYLIPIWLVFLIALGLFVNYLLKLEPMISGSGIPQVEGTIIGYFKLNWLRILILKFIGTILMISAGLSLGREGPCVQLGASIGQGVSRSFKRLRFEEKYLITCGAGAGLAAAFNAPLAGVIFSLEELHKNFSPLVLVSSMVASLTATYITDTFLGLKTVFGITNLPIVPFSHYAYLMVLGVIIGLGGILFNKALLESQDIYNRYVKIPQLKLIIPLVLSVVIGLFIPAALGGGESLVNKISNANLGLKFVLVMLLAKFLFTMVSYGSGVPGGIFMPLLAIGALIGNVYGIITINIFNIDQLYLKDFIVLAMAGYFAAVVRAPITGSLLVTEMTGSFSHLLALSTVSITSYIVSGLLKNMPIYESLLNRIIKNIKKANIDNYNDANKILFEIPVAVGSFIDGKKLKDIEWPYNCLVVGIKRGGIEIIPKGNTKILSGDYIVLLADEDDVVDIKNNIRKMTEI